MYILPIWKQLKTRQTLKWITCNCNLILCHISKCMFLIKFVHNISETFYRVWSWHALFKTMHGLSNDNGTFHYQKVHSVLKGMCVLSVLIANGWVKMKFLLWPLICIPVVYLFSMTSGDVTITYNVSIGAVFDRDYNHYSDLFFRTLALQQDFIHGGKMQGFAFPAFEELYHNLKGVCSLLEKNNILAFVVVGTKQTINTISLIAEPLGIPLLAYIVDDQYQFSKVVYA